MFLCDPHINVYRQDQSARRKKVKLSFKTRPQTSAVVNIIFCVRIVVFNQLLFVRHHTSPKIIKICEQSFELFYM